MTTTRGAGPSIWWWAFGYFAPDGSARFNVAIRTLAVDRWGQATIGLGSGVVADSLGEDEWKECLLKARFLARAAVLA